VETIRYSLLGKEDIALEPRNGVFEVELADGRRVMLHALDVAYFLSDNVATVADLPGPGITGRLMRAGHTLFMDDGTQWISLLTLGQSLKAQLPTPTGGGQLLRVMDDVHGIWWDAGQWIGIDGEQANVKEFGAVGDGTVNDTSAITDAIAAANATHGTVLFPPGTYAPDGTTFVIPTGVSVRSTGRGGLAFVFQGQSNYVNNLMAPLATGTLQQTALFIRMVSGNVFGPGNTSSHPARIAAVFSAETGGGTGLGSGEPVRALNLIVQQNETDTTAQLVGMEMDFGNQKDDATLDMPFPNQVGFSLNSTGSKIAGIALNIAGTGRWIEALQIAAGAVPPGGFVFRYKGNATDAKSLFAITAHGSVQFGFAGTTIGSPGSPVLFNNIPLQSVLNNGSSLVNIISVNDVNTISIDPGQLGTQFGGAIDENVISIQVGNGAPSSPYYSFPYVIVNSRVASAFHLNVLDQNVVNIVNPAEPKRGRRLTFSIRNVIGLPMNTVNWDLGFKLAPWVNPANQFMRHIEFQYDGAFWYETNRNTVDVPIF
jgi:hypothetical protein